MEKVLPSGLREEQLIHLRSLVRKFDNMQDARIAFENRIRAIRDEVTPVGRLGFIIEEKVTKGVNPKSFEEATKGKRGKQSKKVLGMQVYENDLVKQMKPLVESNRLWAEWLSKVKGVGILSAAKIIAYFEPYWAELEVVLRRKKRHRGQLLNEEQVVTQKLYPPKSRSSLGKLCGYGVVEDTGRASKMTAGQKLMGNPIYKSFFYVLSESLIRQKGKPYAIFRKYHEEILDTYADYLQKWYGARTRKEVKKLHKKTYIPNSMDLSRRRFIKTFISIIWEKFQEIYELPIPPPQHAPNQPLTEKEWIHPEDLIE